MFCTTPQIKSADPQTSRGYLSLYQNKERDARITAFVLGMISIFLLAAAFVLFGLGTLSPTFLLGLGVFPYLGGAFLSFVAVGICIGMLIFFAVAAVQNCQKEQWQALWMRQEL